ncbi:MAG: hypothetical protein LBI14_09070 [Treponema sp.]|jgi:hypothetical protein|nr:hypothetical protein [Treponema sp.]
MAKKEKEVYAPGELDRVRQNLKVIDLDEARRMADVLGGEVGYERSAEPVKIESKSKKTRHERVDVKIGDRPSNIPRNRVEVALDQELALITQKQKRQKPSDPEDDPSVSLKVNYFDRIKMDQYAGQSQFEIKSSSQILFSMISVFGDIPDYVNPVFITKRLNEYYQQLETLVTTTRTLFPRNNIRRNERIKKSAPLAFAVLETIRYWNIEGYSDELGKLQSHPRNVKVEDCAEILRAVYRPLFILDKMNTDAHIRGAYKILYKALYMENPIEAQNKYPELLKTAMAAYTNVRKDIRFLMHPLLMKAVSTKLLTYEELFTERKNRIMDFLRVSEDEQIDPAPIARSDSDNNKVDGKPDDKADGRADDEKANKAEVVKSEEKPEETPEELARKAAREGEKKALEKGLQTLEILFPGAGWDRISTCPDLYPYFDGIFDLRKGFVYIAPTDCIQQVFILMRIIEELFFGLRFVSFGTIVGQNGNPETIGESLSGIINNWRYCLESSLDKEYLPRMAEFVRMLESAPENWNSPYTKRIISDLHWAKRLFYLPYYKFDSLATPSFQKKDIIAIYPEIKKLRRYLTAVGAGIEVGKRAGGAEAKARCEGINNPWDRYDFQVPNPLSKRLDALLAEKNRNNASLVYFTLAVATVLDYIANNEDSWAYESRPGPLFRSVRGEGVTPLTGVDNRIDADALFKESVRKRQKG